MLPPVVLFSWDIDTTHSTWHEPLQAMSAVVLRFDGVIPFVGAYREICQHTVYRVLQR